MTAYEKVEVLRRASLRRSLPPLPPPAPRPEQTPEPSAEGSRSSPVAEHARIDPYKGVAPVHSAPAPAKAKSSRLLMAGLKSGEVGKIIDKMEAEDASHNPEDGQTKRAVEESSRPLPTAEPPRIEPDLAAVARDQTAGTPGTQQNQSKAKGARLLMAGLKSGEVGKIVDKMEAEEASPNPEDSHTNKESSRPPEVAEPVRIEPGNAAQSGPPAGASEPVGGKQSKVKGAKLLMAGLKTGEVGRIVDKMEAEEELSRPPEVAEPVRTEDPPPLQSAPPAAASEPPAGNQTKAKGAKLLMAGLKSGEVGKIVDKMEAEESSKPPEVVPPARIEADRGSPSVPSDPPAIASEAPAGPLPKHSKVKGANLLMAGLKSGEVSKIVDSMEAEESSRSAPLAETARTTSDSSAVAVKSDPPVVANEPRAGPNPKESKVKGARLLMAGLKSGEVGKLVDQMEAQDAPQEAAAGQAPGAVEASSTSAPAAEAPRIDPGSGGAAAEPPVGAGEPPAGPPSAPNPTKLKGAKLLMAGLKSGEVSKIVDKMEEEAAKEDGQTKDEAEDDPLFEF